MKPESDRQTAERLSRELGFTVTRGCLRYWRKRSFDLNDPEKLRGQIRNLQKSRPGAKRITAPSDMSPIVPPPRTISELETALIEAPDFERARTIATQLAGLKNAHRLRAEMACYVSKKSVERDAQLVGKIFRAVLEKMAAELPQQIIDKDYAEAVKRCEDYAYGILLTVSSPETYE
jgi:hypothetical protein